MENFERGPDDPICKEKLISQLFGEFIGYVKSKGLLKGKEFETKNEEIFQCSRKFLWIDQYDPKYQITVVLNSIQLSIEFGVVIRNTKEVIHRKKIENLRYKISTKTELELIESSQEKFDDLFNDFKNEFNKLKPTIYGNKV
ncbi:hypothetical protein M0P65_07095 [Candidatus Gracilibacteria bacterium]|jgi:predicted RNase H-related nuclease YkuK (DUF458 family)|nr:hypothetical protein [Candidatus Gracilibacteria bacterium]